MPGWIAFFAIVASILAALAGLLSTTAELSLAATLGNHEVWRILGFTLFQAGLSTTLSLGLAIPFARALARRRQFWGRQWLIRLSSLSLVIPTMVAVLGIAVVHGRNGWLNQGLHALGFDGYSLYGLSGILLAHIFFNMPLAARSFLTAIDSLPQETWRLASQLGLPPSSIFWHIEWPLLRSVIPGLAGLIFMLCFTSFAIVLTLGGGPKYATLEVAIYQALRFDFDIPRGVALASVQIGVCLLLLSMIAAGRKSFTFQPGGKALPSERPDGAYRLGKYADVSVLVLASVFLLSPLVAVIIRAITPAFATVVLSNEFLQALYGSVVIALDAGILAMMLALPIAFLLKNLAQQRKRRLQNMVETGSSLILVIPPLTLGMGLFLLLRAHTNLFEAGLYLLILINALLAVPFVLRIIQPPIHAAGQQIDRLSESLGVRGWPRLQRLYWPMIRRPASFALALAVALSLGDMGVIALFGSENLSTLPLHIYRQIAAYRMDQAAVTAFMLCLLCLLAFWSIERLLGGKHDA